MNQFCSFFLWVPTDVHSMLGKGCTKGVVLLPSINLWLVFYIYPVISQLCYWKNGLSIWIYDSFIVPKNEFITWWTIPEPGGTINMLLNAPAPHLRKVNRSLFLSNSKASFFVNASFEPEKSTCTEWSMTKSAGHWGLIELASPP